MILNQTVWIQCPFMGTTPPGISEQYITVLYSLLVDSLTVLNTMSVFTKVQLHLVYLFLHHVKQIQQGQLFQTRYKRVRGERDMEKLTGELTILLWYLSSSDILIKFRTNHQENLKNIIQVKFYKESLFFLYTYLFQYR